MQRIQHEGQGSEVTLSVMLSRDLNILGFLSAVCMCVRAHVHLTEANMVPCVYEVMHEVLKVNASVIRGEISVRFCVYVSL